MLRILWFSIKLAIFVAAAVWVANRPGMIDIHWQGYDVRVNTSLALLSFFFFVVVLLVVHRVLFALFALPKTWRHYRARINEKKGYRSLTLGLGAAAAGDTKLAFYHAQQARALLPRDRGLSVLLEAQAARLQGDTPAADAAFEILLNNKDTAFLGLRGLLQMALEDNSAEGAAALSARALKLYPKHPFVLRMVYDMAVRARHWGQAQKLLDKIARLKGMAPAKIKSERVALLLQQAEEVKDGAALSLLRRAYRLDPSFVPAAQRLARYYLDHKKRRSAVSVLEKTWKQSPHHDLLLLWKEAAPHSKAHDSAARLRWFEKLALIHPGSVEAKMAVASAAMDEHMWGVARQHLDAVEKGTESARFYHLRARLAQVQNDPDEQALMLRYAADAGSEKVWVCRDSGHVYERWSPVAAPHGSFNTIVWDYQRPLRAGYVAGADDLLRLQK